MFCWVSSPCRRWTFLMSIRERVSVWTLVFILQHSTRFHVQICVKVNSSPLLALIANLGYLLENEYIFSFSAFFSSIFWKVAMTIISIKWQAVNMMNSAVLMRSTSVFSVVAGVPFQPWMNGFCLLVHLSNEALQSHTLSAQLLDYIIPGDVRSSQSPCIVIFSASTLRSLFSITPSSLAI